MKSRCTPSTAFLYLLVFVFTPGVYSFNATYFTMYKNTVYKPCPSYSPDNALPPPSTVIQDDWSSSAPLTYYPYTFLPMSDAQFCRYFSNYTVITTVPRNSAFHIAWAENLVNAVAISISVIMLAISCRDIDDEFSLEQRLKEERKAREEVELGDIEDSTGPLVEDGQSSRINFEDENEENGGLLENRESPLGKPHNVSITGHLKTAVKYCWKGPKSVYSSLSVPRTCLLDLSILFWILITDAVISLILWLKGFAYLMYDSGTAYPVALYSFLAPYAYSVSAARAGVRNTWWSSMTPLLLSFIQWILSIVALARLNHYTHIGQQAASLSMPGPGISPTNVGPPHYDFSGNASEWKSAGNCSLADLPSSLFVDPTTAGLLSFYAQPVLFGFISLFYICMLFSLIVTRLRHPGELSAGPATSIIVVAVVAIMNLVNVALNAGRSRPPVSWDMACGVVHVMMDAKLGYWDARVDDWAYRIAKAWFLS